MTVHSSQPAGAIWQPDLVRNARTSVRNYHINGERSLDAPILEGHLATESLQAGLKLHLVDARINQPFSFEADLEPCLKFSLVLSGETRLSYGTRELVMGPGFGCQQDGGQQRLQLVSLSRPEGCFQRGRQGDIRRSLTVSLTPEWLARQQLDTPFVRGLLDDHLRMLSCGLPDLQLQLAQQLFLYTADEGASRLMRESITLNLVVTLLQQLQQSPVEDKGTPRRDRQLLEFLESGEADGLSQGEIGDRLGMSVATLQRHAQRILEMPLQRYLRKRRLAMARTALLNGEMSIAEAAGRAGYNHAANFTTAFRREFGISPLQVLPD